MSVNFSPMKKIDTLKRKQRQPKKETVDFLLRFSKNLENVKGKNRNFLISKN